jgi:hypothetical protein
MPGTAYSLIPAYADWNDENEQPVIPGEQCETRNPGGSTRGLCRMLLDARSPRRPGTSPQYGLGTGFAGMTEDGPSQSV